MVGSKMRRGALTLAAALIAAGLVGGCAQESSTAPSPSPNDSPSPSSSASTAPVEVTAYFVGETTRGPRLFPEHRTVETTDPDTAALETALGAPLDPDYSSAWSDLGVTVNSVSLTTDTIVADLGGIADLRARPQGMTSAAASASVHQILWTLKDAFGTQQRRAVQILSDGEHTDQLLGVPTSEPLAFGKATKVLAQVWISNLEEGDTVSSPVQVEGLGAAFEAQLVWRVLDESGAVVKKGTTMAEECCRMAPYAFTVELDPGTYTIVVEDTDPSGGEGFGPWQDSKTVTVA